MKNTKEVTKKTFVEHESYIREMFKDCWFIAECFKSKKKWIKEIEDLMYVELKRTILERKGFNAYSEIFLIGLEVASEFVSEEKQEAKIQEVIEFELDSLPLEKLELFTEFIPAKNIDSKEEIVVWGRIKVKSKQAEEIEYDKIVAYLIEELGEENLPKFARA